MAQLVKTEDGLAIASVKTVAGLAIASVKSIYGLDNTSAGSFTARQTNNSTTFDYQYINRTVNNAYCATKFTAGAAYTVTKVTAPLYKTGTPTFNLTCAIFDTSLNLPNAQVGTASDAISVAGFPTSEGADATFVNLSASLTNGVAYWVVIFKSSGSDNFNVDFCHWPFQNNGAGTPPINYVSTNPPVVWVEDRPVSGFLMPGKMVVYSTP